LSFEMNELRISSLQTGASLGAGTSGEVFEVLGEEQSLVIKRFHSLAIDRSFLKYNYTRQLGTPPFVGFPGILEHSFDQSPYAVLMEKVSGKPLLKAGSMKEATAWEMIRKLSEITGHAHKHGVYHGHLHPGNILLSGTGAGAELFVTDFGSGLVGDLHHIDLGESTFFAAPEQLLTGGKKWTEGQIQKWDVYSFGMVAFWLINERLPRGLAYIKERNRQIAHSGGRPVGINIQEFVDELHEHETVVWGSSFALNKHFRPCREIIDRCLSLDPLDRPVDLREVRNLFRALDYRFALEDAEERVLKERRKQKAKLIGARAIAACLGLSFLGATYLLVEYFRKTYFFQNKVTELDQVVVTQQAQIHHLDERWADTVTDLKQSRQAADSFFHQMARGDDAGGSGVAAINKEELEKSRDYYLETLEGDEEGKLSALERARALHSLAHIERKMGLSAKSIGHFRSAVDAFVASGSTEPVVEDSRIDIEMRLADSYENISSLLENPLGYESLQALEKAVHHFDALIALKPNDLSSVTRLAGTAFKLGRVYDAHREFDKAIHAYTKSVDLAVALRSGSETPEALTELIGKLQFQAAESLRMAGRIDESINAHIAAMETVEQLRGVNGFTSLQSVQLAEGYLELGELFVSKEATPEDLDQLFNESLRLLSSLNTGNPEDVEVAILLSRSLGHLGTLEREDGHWSAGYRMSVRGIEALRVALEVNPDHVEGTLALAEARIEHLAFLGDERDAAIRVALKGVETAGQHLGPGSLVSDPLLTQLRERLSAIFATYGDICEDLGESSISRHCREQSAARLSSGNSAESAANDGSVLR
jgi:tetratricopeptide (TPR) repeat protein